MARDQSWLADLGKLFCQFLPLATFLTVSEQDWATRHGPSATDTSVMLQSRLAVKASELAPGTTCAFLFGRCDEFNCDARAFPFTLFLHFL
jgi:hypothetical protein